MFKPLTDYISVNKETDVDVPDGAIVYDLIQRLVELYGNKLKEILLDTLTEKLKVIVLVDGKYGELKTKLREGSKVFFMIPYAGG